MAALAASSSRSVACCCSWRLRRRGTFLRAWRILTRDIRWATTPRQAMCTASGTSTSSTSIFCAFSASDFPTTTTSCRCLAYWLLHLVWLFPWSLFLPGAAGGGVADAAPVDAASTPRCRTDGGFLSGQRSARRRGDYVQRVKFRARTIWLLSLFSAFTLLFF